MMTKPKVYVIGKFEQKELVRDVYRRLREIGYEISYDWTTHKFIAPFAQNPDLAAEYSEEELKAISQSSIVIYLSDKNSNTSKCEMGSAIMLNFLRGEPMIFAVGDFNEATPWFINPRVIRRKSIEEVISELQFDSLSH